MKAGTTAFAALLMIVAVLALALHGEGPAAPVSPFKYSGLYCRTLLNNGSPAHKADLVILGDGYLRKELASGGKFEKDCRELMANLFLEPPFDRHKSFFNVHAVYVESLEGGEKVGNVVWPKMALGTKFLGYRGYIDLMNFTYKDKVEEAAFANAPDCDIIMVMVNVKGTGGSNAIWSRKKGKLIPAPCFSAEGNHALDTSVHELGHSLGNLADEYEDEQSWDDKPLPKEGDLRFPNVSLKEFIDPSTPATIRKTAKWGHFLDLPGASKAIGAYQGGYYRYVGVYRPQWACKMREFRVPFCWVCQEALVRAIYEICSIPFDDAKYHRENPIR